MPWRGLLKILVRDVSGFNFVQLVRGKRRPGPARFTRPGVHPRWLRPLFYVALAAALTATGGWPLFLLYWIVPLFTVLQLIIRWGAITEHEYNHRGARVIDTTPLIVLPWWQRLLLPNLDFTLHVYHHYFPGVSFTNLRRVHQLFRQHGLVDESAVFRGYGAYLQHLQRPPSARARS
jgi:fatty acid desaturase